MTSAVLRVVVVLYRSRLKSIRPMLETLAPLAPGIPLSVCVAINRDDLAAPVARTRSLVFGSRVPVHIYQTPNSGGVAGAYAVVMASASDDDVVLLLDADARLPALYFEDLWKRREAMRDRLRFTAPELYSGSMRISPYSLAGLLPKAIDTPLDRALPLRFADGIGVINSGLAGSVRAFRAVDGFDARIGLDLSDVAWSLCAAARGAELVVFPGACVHDLSIHTRGMSFRRFRMYLTACWRLGWRNGDPVGGLRLALRGVRAMVTGGVTP